MPYLKRESCTNNLKIDSDGWYYNDEMDINPDHIIKLYERAKMKPSQWQSIRDAFSASALYYRKYKFCMSTILHLENDLIITG